MSQSIREHVIQLMSDDASHRNAETCRLFRLSPGTQKSGNPIAMQLREGKRLAISNRSVGELEIIEQGLQFA